VWRSSPSLACDTKCALNARKDAFMVLLAISSDALRGLKYGNRSLALPAASMPGNAAAKHSRSNSRAERMVRARLSRKHGICGSASMCSCARLFCPERSTQSLLVSRCPLDVRPPSLRRMSVLRAAQAPLRSSLRATALCGACLVPLLLSRRATRPLACKLRYVLAPLVQLPPKPARSPPSG